MYYSYPQWYDYLGTGFPGLSFFLEEVQKKQMDLFLSRNSLKLELKSTVILIPLSMLVGLPQSVFTKFTKLIELVLSLK